MRLGILGPLLVTDEAGRQVQLAGRARVLLTALALRANQIVPAEELVELMFDGAPSAESTIRSYMRRLRLGLGPEWSQRIITHPPGYLCRADESEVDALAFEALCRQTGTALQRRQWAEASDAAGRAVALWRGVPLSDVASPALREQFVPRLEQLHVQVLEDQAEAGLRLGRHEQLVRPLRELVTQHPLRERFHAQLVLALARSGRQAEALTAYQDARKTVVGELGVEPGPELRALHERIMAGDEARPDDAPPSDDVQTPTPPPTATVPRQLPAAPGHFTGRLTELKLLTGLADHSGPRAAASGTVVISAIDGMAGIGKTALAIHAAHRLADRFPDGQLFIDLHGYTQGQSPRTASQALNWLLSALGVPPERIPHDIEQAAALYRQRLADTRTLIVLDNAATEAQVRPLLPGDGSCLVLVTSRRRLKALDDAHTVALDLLTPPDAVALLRAVAGPGRIPPDDPLADEIAELCGYLPLALRIAASLLRHRPSWHLEHLAGQLRDQRRRVAAFSDGERELATVFDLSYTSLDEQHQRLWRRLGLIPGPDLDAYAAAALEEISPATAGGLLEDIVDHNLLIAYAPGRYRLHDLLRAHARALAETDAAAEREAAQGRLLHYYAHTAQSASVSVARYPRSGPDDPAPSHIPALADAAAARAWLRTEHPNVDAAFTHAHTRGLDGDAIALATGLAEILQADGPLPRALEIHRSAAETAERLGRRADQADALTDLGRVRYLTQEYPVTVDILGRSLEIHRALGLSLGEANTLTELGRVWQLTGDFPAADDALSQALEIYRALGLSLGEAYALTELGRVRQQTGDYLEAGEALSRAFELYRALSHRLGEANVLIELARVRYLTGDYPRAQDAVNQALEIYRALGQRDSEATALTEMARVRSLTGDLSGATDVLNRALEIYRAENHRLGQAHALSHLGRIRYLTGDYPRADEALSQALEVYRALGLRLGEAYALTELGHVRRLTGDYVEAGDALSQALEIYRALGHRGNEAWALNSYAGTLAATDQRPRALALYQQALAMNRDMRKRDDEAISLEGIAEHHLATGDLVQGIAYLNQALEIHQSLGAAPDARRVRELLDGLAA